MKKLTIRPKGNGVFDVGFRGIGPAVVVNAIDKKSALKKAKAILKPQCAEIAALPTRFERHGRTIV